MVLTRPLFSRLTCKLIEVMRKSLIFFFLIATPFAVNAQRSFGFISWDMQVPLTNKEWIDSPSPHGGALGFRFFVKEQKLSVGLDLNWTTFDQYEPTQTFPQDNGAITTDYYKYVYQYGAAATVQYYFPWGDQEIIFPYVGMGLGANYNQFNLYYNIYQESDKATGFLVRPEAGVIVKFGKYRSVGAMVAAHYDYSTVKYPDYNYSGFSSAGVRLGIVFMGRD
jgi:hypothetical protein